MTKHPFALLFLGAGLLLTLSCSGFQPRVLPPASNGQSASAVALERMASLERFLKKHPHDVDALQKLAPLAAFFDDSDQRAWSLLRRAASKAPWNLDASLLACELSTQSRHYQDIERYCGKVLKMAPTKPEAVDAMAALETLFGQTLDRDPTVLRLMQQGLNACQQDPKASCAPLALRLARAALTLAGQQDDKDSYQAALASVSAVQTWDICRLSPAGIDFFRGARDDEDLTKKLAPSVCRTRQTSESLVYPSAYSPAGVFVIQTAVHASQSGPIWTYLRLPGAARVRVDGVTLSSRDPWSRPADDTQLSRLWLARGWHHIEVLVQPRRNDEGLLLWAVGEHGGPAFDQVQAHRPAGQELARVRVLGHESPQNRDGATGIDLAHPWQLLRQVQIWADDFAPRGEAARSLATQLVGAYPKSAQAWFALAEGLRTDPTLPGSVREAELRKALEATLQRQPHHLLAGYRLAITDFSERPDQSLQRMREVVRENPRYPWGLRRLYGMLMKRGFKFEAQQILKRALALAPDSNSLGLAEKFYRRQQAWVKWRALREKQLPMSSDLSSYRRVRWLAQQGDSAEALKLFDTMFARAPDSPGYSSVYALALQVEGWDGVGKRALERLRLFPMDQDSAEWLMRAARGGSDLIDPSEALAKAEALSPGDPAWFYARERLGINMASVLPRPDVDKLMQTFLTEREAKPEIYAGHPYTYVLDAAALAWLPSGGLIEWTQQLIRVETKTGADALGQQHLPMGAELEELRIIKADGKIFEPEDRMTNGDISLPNLEVGDFIEKRYRQFHSPDRIYGAARTRFFFASKVPVFQGLLVVQVADEILPSLDLDAVKLAAPERQRVDGGQRLTYRVHGVAALQDEPFAESPLAFTPHLTMSQGYALPLFAQRATRRMADGLASNLDVERFAHRVSDQLQPGQNLIQQMLLAVAKQVPSPGRERNPLAMLHAHQGQGLFLLRSSLKTVGVDARLIGLRATDKVLQHDWPGNSFQHVALAVQRNGAWWPIYFAQGSAMLGTLPRMLRGGQWIFVDPDWPQDGSASQAKDIPESWISSMPHQVELQATLDDLGTLQGVLKMHIQAPEAGMLRQALRRMDPRDAQRALEAWLGTVLAGSRLHDLKVEGLDDVLKPLTLNLTFVSVGYAALRSEALVVERLLPTMSLLFGRDSASLSSFVRLGTRQTAMYLPSHDEHSRISIAFSKHRRLLSLPPELHLRGAFGTYSQEVTQGEGRLEIERDVHRPRTWVAPTAYAAMRSEAQRLQAALGSQLVLVAKQPAKTVKP